MKCKKLTETAILPTRAYTTDAGLDLYSDHDVMIPNGGRAVVKTGIAMAIPEGKVGLIWPRSGLAVKKGVDILAGVIDSQYRGEVMVCIQNTNPREGDESFTRGYRSIDIKRGDKIAQILIQDVCLCDVEEVDDLDSTDRGADGFGSTDKP